MSTLKIAFQEWINSITNKKLIEIKPEITVELQVEVSFSTFCQVSYTNEEGNYCIREFTGKTWSKKLFLIHERDIQFSVFVNNHLLLKEQTLVMTKLLNNEIVLQQKIQLDATSTYSGWYKLK
ncbi:MAG: hypothetical protein WCO43_04090 [Chitinophagia bacterium]|jgi:hypothetical protein